MTELKTSEQGVIIKVVPSPLYNNLAHCNGLRIYASKSDVVLVKAQSARILGTNEEKQDSISHVTTGLFRGKALALVTCSSRTDLWDLSKELLMTSIKHESRARTFTIVDAGSGKLVGCVGHTNGEVALLELAEDFSATPIARERVHTGDVTALAAASAAGITPTMASGDIGGTIVLWNGPTVIKSITAHTGDPVVSLAVDPLYVVAAFGGGKIRLFNGTTGEIQLDIAAHARWINAMTFEPSTHQAATCSEDGMVCVWQLPTTEKPKASLLKYKNRSNTLWTGCCFCDPSTLCAVAFDVDHMFTYNM